MSDQLPVTVAVKRADGTIEHLRIGTAVPTGEGFSLRFNDLSIGGGHPYTEAAPAYRAAPAAAAAAGDLPTLLPNYGRSKSAPILGASMQDLEYYANGARRSLSDPSKSRWHDKERQLLQAIDAEIARQGGGSAGGGYEGSGGGYEGSGGGSSGPDYGGPPPHDDDDIPF